MKYFKLFIVLFFHQNVFGASILNVDNYSEIKFPFVIDGVRNHDLLNNQNGNLSIEFVEDFFIQDGNQVLHFDNNSVKV